MVLLGAKVESPESAWSDGAQAATPMAMIMMGRDFGTSSLLFWHGKQPAMGAAVPGNRLLTIVG
ncbi:hypothetical protein TomMM35A_30360 [Sphingobium sp. TomMM35A]